MNKLEELELKILREAVDKAEERQKKRAVNGPEIEKIINTVEEFLRNEKLICYGGTAINNILPEEDQFYNRDLEIPDYDFYSANALEDAKELADIYAKEFDDVEAKAGVHFGTYKVFVNYIPVADITYMNKDLYESIKKESISVGGILYAAPNFLRMAMYLELSRPEGDTSRWEKVLKRLILLNKNYPLYGIDCLNMNFQRGLEIRDKKKEADIFNITRDALIGQGVVFFGSLAHGIYSTYMPKREGKRIIQKNPDFDVMSMKPFFTATVVKERLEYNGYKNVSISKKDGVGEVIAPHYEVLYGIDTICFIYEPLACHSYNVVDVDKRKVRIATIDTMLSFYLAFLYANRPYYDKNRILCMTEFLFKVQQRNRLQQKGVLRRFNINCYGSQPTLEDIREEKTKKYNELMDKKHTKEYEEWFLRYIPNNNSDSKANAKPKTKGNTKAKEKAKTKTKAKTKAKAKAKTQRSGKNLLGDLFKLNQKKKDGFKIPLY